MLINIIEYARFNQLNSHTESVNSIKISTDKSTIFSGSDDKTIRIWKAVTGECVRVLEGHTDWVYSIAISADASTIFSGSRDKTICIWKAATGECVRTL